MTQTRKLRCAALAALSVASIADAAAAPKPMDAMPLLMPK